MPDQDRAVQASQNGAVQGRVVQQNPDAIVAEIERTRQDLAATIDALAERVSPANNASKLRERAREQLARPEVRMALAAVGLAVTAVVILKVWGGRRKR